MNAGFPEESISELNYDFKSEDSNLDIIAALLVMGLTPNVCYHKEKRKVRFIYFKCSTITLW